MPTITISIITVFPELFETWLATSLVARAQKNNLIHFNLMRLADFAEPKERIDTPMCGPGAGMVLKAPLVAAAIDAAHAVYGQGPVIVFSPAGELLTQEVAKQYVQEYLSCVPSSPADMALKCTHLVLICGRYEGVDCRVLEKYDARLVSIGQYVVMGGDLPAQIFLEVVLRYVPGIVGDRESVERDSFSGALVDFPAYGLPAVWEGREVPPVLLSGNHKAIEEWRRQTSLQLSVHYHFDWVRCAVLSAQERSKAIAAAIPAHYVVLMHDQVLIGRQTAVPGTTSVTTIDVHDIARSSATYGIKGFYIVTPLKDQQELLRVFFAFWHTEKGMAYNENRYDAMRLVKVMNTIEEVEADIAAEQAGVLPMRIATSARAVAGVPSLAFHEQKKVWPAQKPVLLIFGTGQGLTEDFLRTCAYLLVPVHGFSAYNHLSVRAAVAIILDRWLGYYQPMEHDHIF